jgi:predicted kinase
MLKIIMTVGLPGCGKSTWAKDFLKQHEGFEIVEKDLFRAQVFKDNNVKWSRENETKYIMPFWINKMEDLLKKGISIISSDCNLTKVNKNVLNELSKKYKAELIEQDFTNVPVEVCIDRDSLRDKDKKVGPKKITKLYQDHIISPIREKSKETQLNLMENYVKITEKTIICDIDGTVAIMGERSPFDWQSVDKDIPILPVIDTLKALKKSLNAKLVFVSGRDEECKEKTIKWLNEVAKIEFEAIYMRKHRDFSPDYKVKEEIFYKHLKNNYNICMVFDDRPQVVKIWRKLGFFVFDVNQSGVEF